MDEFNRNSGENKNRKKRKSSFRKSLSKLLDKDGFFVILFICICIVATTAVWVSSNNLEKIRSIEKNDNINLVEENNELEDNSPITAKSNNDVDKSKTDETKDENEQVKKEQKKEDVATANSTQSNKLLKSMVLPLKGTLGMDYAENKLVYSKTLEQWTTHKGVDIKAAEGSVVRAALDGVVKEIQKNQELGIVITIDHGQGLLTKYANLSTDEMVNVGQKVKNGDPISGVSKGFGFELNEGSHLHFEVIKDGKNINPKTYLPKFQ